VVRTCLIVMMMPVLLQGTFKGDAQCLAEQSCFVSVVLKERRIGPARTLQICCTPKLNSDSFQANTCSLLGGHTRRHRHLLCVESLLGKRD
jgi:hypothetical protein